MRMIGSSRHTLRHQLTSSARAVLVAGAMTMCTAQAQPAEPGIYTCIDSKGRKLTSDRPIAECNDREQKLLNPSGTVRSKLGPTLTARERDELELKEKAALEERTRANEERRRDRALLVRYPNRGVHDKERAGAVNQVGIVRQAAVNRVDELLRQRKVVDLELEFYKKDPAKAPASLRRQADEITQSLAIQNRFIADQDTELKRVNTRFDDELERLKQLWLARNSGTPTATNSTR